jgi:ribose 5-phosphate isomerase A
MDGLKRQAAAQALAHVQDGMKLGLGTGSTAKHFVDLLGEKVAGGMKVVGVPTSEATRAQAEACKIPLTTLDAIDRLDLTVDGADEVDRGLNLIKGYGGAFVRERIVAAASRRQVILVTADKLVETLGGRGRLPVEVLPFALPLCQRRLEDLGLKPALRTREERPFVTDNFNVIVDCTVGPIADPAALERAILAIPGVIDTGLFLGTADTVLVSDGETVRELVRRRSR